MRRAGRGGRDSGQGLERDDAARELRCRHAPAGTDPRAGRCSARCARSPSSARRRARPRGRRTGARGKSGTASRSQFQPTWSTWRCVRKTMSISSGLTPIASRPLGSRPSRSGIPVVPQTGGTHAGVDEDRRLLRANHVREAGKAPRRAGDELWIERVVRIPVFLDQPGIRLGVLAQHADRVEHRLDLDRADYHRTRGGAGSAVCVLPRDHRIAEDADAARSRTP